MSPYYPVFSLIILPLNSVLNPILYNGLFSKVLDKAIWFVAELFGMIEVLMKGGGEVSTAGESAAGAPPIPVLGLRSGQNNEG